MGLHEFLCCLKIQNTLQFFKFRVLDIEKCIEITKTIKKLSFKP